MDAVGKILFILHMPPPVHGAAMMGQYIHDSVVINSTFECEYINLATATNMEDIGKFKWRKLLPYWRLLKHIRKAVKKERPRLVYITPNAAGEPFYKDFVVVMMLKAMGCKVVAHYHNKGVSTRQHRWLDDMLYRMFFRGLKVILLSDCLYPDVQRYVERKNVWICPNGIGGNAHPSPSSSHFRLLFLSNLLMEKGVIVLLDALKILKERGHAVVCDFVGDETAEISRAQFEQEVHERGLENMAVYQGKQYGDEKERFWNRADVFVFPTFYRNECFPLVVLEAMQHGVPVVTTAEGGIPDMVRDGENGFLCERQNPKDLAEKLERMVSDLSLREKMGQDGYLKYRKYYTLEFFEKRLVDILKAEM